MTFYIFYKFNNYFLFFLSQFISVVFILFSLFIYNFKKFKFNKIFFLIFLVLSLTPNYLYSLKNSFTDSKQKLISKINHNIPLYNLNCSNRNKIYKEYEGFEYPV